jgi:uncharacterized protein
VNLFVVPVASLLRSPGTTTTVRFDAVFDPSGAYAASARGAAEAVPGAEVTVDLGLTSFLGGVDAHGTLAIPWRASCRRCAGDVAGTLDIKVHEQFRHGAAPDDEDAYPLENEEVDLAELVRDAVVLELPLAPLCRVDCAGLCATCGADRNLTACACRPDLDPRWATLDALRVPDQA